MIPEQTELDRYTFDAKDLAGWKSYPIRLTGPRPSLCHQATTLLVKSIRTDFISANCIACGASEAVTPTEFFSLDLWVGCPHCHKALAATMILVPGCYAFACPGCGIYVLLADLLPLAETVGE